MDRIERLGQQLASLHAISVEIAALHDLPLVQERALDHGMRLTESMFGFTGLLDEEGTRMEVAAVKGIGPLDPAFYAVFHRMAVSASVVGLVLQQERPRISNDVLHDPNRVGLPPGHPPVHTFLGVPLHVGDRLIGMMGVANKPAGYDASDELLLSTLANQVAVAIDNARLYEQQREMIHELTVLHDRLSGAERERLLSRERDRIACAIHDRVGQEVFAIGALLTSMLEGGGVDPALEERLRRVREVAVQAAGEVRQSIFGLTGDTQGDSDLAGEIRVLLAGVERNTGLEAELSVSGSPAPAVEQVRELVRWVIGEAVTNVLKHAQAQRVLVSIRYEPDRLSAAVQDDGAGAPAATLRGFAGSYLHFGLRHMRELVLENGGSFEVANGDEAGLVVRASLPLREEAP